MRHRTFLELLSQAPACSLLGKAVMNPEIITSAYEGSRIRGLSVAQSIHALKMEGVPLGILIEVYQQRWHDGASEGDNARLDELQHHREKNPAWSQVEQR